MRRRDEERGKREEGREMKKNKRMRIFSIPNLLSLGNLLCGCIAILNVIDGHIGIAVYLVMLACVFDFLDGFAARGLKQGSPMGKELDSLADMVTFGVVPGMVMFQMIRYADTGARWGAENSLFDTWLPYIGFMIPLFSALRLAKFNVDTKQSGSFVGLPTLANALLICGLPILFRLNDSQLYVFDGYTYLMNDYVPRVMESLSALQSAMITFWRSQITLASVTVVMSVLLISPVPMFSFKVQNVKWKGNEIRYIFLGICVALLSLMKLGALPLIIVVYIGLSAVYALTRRNSQQP
jgi:CDP-diacylglycerol--serine O-phosphatidyltransferase